MLYQYIWLWHTMISIVAWEEKVKVVNGEIIETGIPKKIMLRNGFQEIDYTTPLLNDLEDEKVENEEIAQTSEKTEEKPLENDVKTEEKVEEKPKITTKK